MPPWIQSALDVAQLVVNFGALVGGAIIWKLYVGNLKAALTSKNAEISSVEKNRDMWRDKAQELEKRSPEFMEHILSERIETRESEIKRLTEDKDKNVETLALLQREKANLESDLSRTRGFRLMLAIEEEDEDEDETPEAVDVHSSITQASEIRVVLLGEVGVDSGQLMITDPCYIDSEWQHDLSEEDDTTAALAVQEIGPASAGVPDERLPPYSYEGAMEATLADGYGELAFRRGHAGAGVVFATAWGDGMYPIYGELHDGRIIRAYINVA